VNFANGLSKTQECDASVADVTVGVRPESIGVSFDEATLHLFANTETGEALTSHKP